MENKDVEKLLKESAEELKAKDFSERWKNISERINSAQEVEIKETTSETVLVTSVNTNTSQNSIRKKIGFSVCAVFLLRVMCLAIVLPITLKTNDKPIFFNLDELNNDGVSEDEFYNKIYEADLKIFNIEDFDVDSYILFYTEDNIVVGGKFEINDEDEGIYSKVIFYDTSVKSSFEIGEDYKSYNVNGFNIEYKTALFEELYSTTAKAVGANISYEFECLAIDENIESFFDKLFG